MAVVIDDVDRAGVYARSSQGRRVQPAATNRHSHISTRRWCISGLAVKQGAYDRSRVFSRACPHLAKPPPFLEAEPRASRATSELDVGLACGRTVRSVDQSR